MSDIEKELWDQETLAEHLGVSVRSLERHRVTGEGIPFVKLGRLIRYRKVDIDAFIARSVRTSTSDRGVAA